MTHPALEAEAGHQLGRDLVLVDHGAVDPVHLRKLVAVGDVGQHRAPHHHRQAEPVVGFDRGDRRDRAIVRDRGDDARGRRPPWSPPARRRSACTRRRARPARIRTWLSGSALRSLTASSAELRPPMPLAAVPPVSGPMKATLTLSLAAAGSGTNAKPAANPRATRALVLIMRLSPLVGAGASDRACLARCGPAHASPAYAGWRHGCSAQRTEQGPLCRARGLISVAHRSRRAPNSVERGTRQWPAR